MRARVEDSGAKERNAAARPTPAVGRCAMLNRRAATGAPPPSASTGSVSVGDPADYGVYGGPWIFRLLGGSKLPPAGGRWGCFKTLLVFTRKPKPKQRTCSGASAAQVYPGLEARRAKVAACGGLFIARSEGRKIIDKGEI